MADKIKVTLTGARPVKIDPDLWPVIADAKDKEFDGQYEFQANRKSDYLIRVRQHASGCALVYATYEFVTQWQGESCLDVRAGRKLNPGEDVIAAINWVAAEMSSEIQGPIFRRLARECVGDLPAEDLECPAEVRREPQAR